MPACETASSTDVLTPAHGRRMSVCQEVQGCHSVAERAFTCWWLGWGTRGWQALSCRLQPVSAVLESGSSQASGRQ